MLDRLDDPTPFVPDERFRQAVAQRGRQLRRRRRALTTSMASVLVLVGLAFSAFVYVARRDAAIDRIPVTMTPSTDGAINVLVVGSDVLPTAGPASADMVGIVRFETDGSVRVLSIPRDLWDPQQNRTLNDDYMDGAQLLVDRVTGLTGLPIDHYVGLDFAGFARLVDEFGGLRVGVDRPLRDAMSGLDLPAAACTTLDGETTLTLVRSRYVESQNDVGEWGPEPGGDESRIARDQVIMKIAVASLADTGADLLTIDGYTRVLADHAVLDSGLSLAKLTRLGHDLASAGSAGTSAETVPVEETVAPGGETVLRLTAAAPTVLQRFGATGSGTVPPAITLPPAPIESGIHSC